MGCGRQHKGPGPAVRSWVLVLTPCDVGALPPWLGPRSLNVYSAAEARWPRGLPAHTLQRLLRVFGVRRVLCAHVTILVAEVTPDEYSGLRDCNTLPRRWQRPCELYLENCGAVAGSGGTITREWGRLSRSPYAGGGAGHPQRLSASPRLPGAFISLSLLNVHGDL